MCLRLSLSIYRSFGLGKCVPPYGTEAQGFGGHTLLDVLHERDGYLSLLITRKHLPLTFGGLCGHKHLPKERRSGNIDVLELFAGAGVAWVHSSELEAPRSPISNYISKAL